MASMAFLTCTYLAHCHRCISKACNHSNVDVCTVVWSFSSLL